MGLSVDASKLPIDSIAQALEAEALVTGEATRQRLVTFLELLLTWNKAHDLTAARTDAELWDLMFADALVLATRIPKNASVVDVGTGAGAPGLVLGILRPDLKLCLVEPLQKRVAFLRTVTGTLKVTQHVEVRQTRGANVVQGSKWDVAISRATLPPAQWLPLGASLGHDVWVFLAREEAPAAPGLHAIEHVHYTWPQTGAPRSLVRYLSA